MAPLRRPKREAFAQAVAKSPKTGKSATQCYEASGYRTTGHASEAAASRLLSKVEVRDRIDEIMRPAVTKTRVTVESLLLELETTIQDARADGQHGTVVAALTLSAKLVGLLKDKIEIANVSPFAGLDAPATIDKLISDLGDGSAQRVLDHLDHLRTLVLERAANQATGVASTSSKPPMSEASAALELFHGKRR
jgi:hypothetical protein